MQTKKQYGRKRKDDLTQLLLSENLDELLNNKCQFKFFLYKFLNCSNQQMFITINKNNIEIC